MHFWQNDQDLLQATAVTQGRNGYWNTSQHRKITLEKKILLLPLQGLEPATFWSWVCCSTAELSPLPNVCFPLCDFYFLCNPPCPIRDERKGNLEFRNPFLFFCSLSVALSPWPNRHGWLGVKKAISTLLPAHQLCPCLGSFPSQGQFLDSTWLVSALSPVNHTQLYQGQPALGKGFFSSSKLHNKSGCVKVWQCGSSQLLDWLVSLSAISGLLAIVLRCPDIGPMADVSLTDKKRLKTAQLVHHWKLWDLPYCNCKNRNKRRAVQLQEITKDFGTDSLPFSF